MNYFSFGQIIFGISLLIVSGSAAAVLSMALHLFFSCRKLFSATLVSLYKNRAKPLHFRMQKKEFLIEKNAVFGGIADFFSVLFLSVGYLLSSYIAFDGVYRLLCVFPILASFLFVRRYPSAWIEKGIFLLFCVFVSALELVLSIPIFFGYMVFRVLKMMFWFIMHLGKRIWAKVMAKPLSSRYLGKIDRALKEGFESI